MDMVTSTHAIVTYSWGDFKHDARKVLLQYFDAMLYLANWGTRRLIFRFPKSVIDHNSIRPYCREDFLSLDLDGSYCTLEFSLDDEEGDCDWVEGEGNALGNLGNAYAALGEARKAIEFYEKHMDIAREIGDRRGEGAALGNLGVALYGLGEKEQGVEQMKQALMIFEAIESPSAEDARDKLKEWMVL